MSARAFQGPNGWYVAWERKDGCHRQPDNGGTLSRRDAEKLARERNDDSERKGASEVRS